MGCKGILNFMIVVWVGIVMCSSPAMAEVIELNSGKTIEGEVFEETDTYIRIITERGNSYKIKQKHILSRSSEKQDIIEDTDKSVFEAEWDTEHTFDDWQAWGLEHGTYLTKTGGIQEQFVVIMGASGVKINRHLASGQIKEALQTGYAAGNQMRQLQQEVKDLTPPEMLESYHEKLLAAVQYEIKSIDAWLLGDQHVCRRYNRKALDRFIGAIEDLTKAHQKMGAPGHVIGKQEFMAQRFREMLDSVYYYAK